MQHKNYATSMGEDNITSLLIRFSMPATMAMLVTASYNIVDTIFVGRLGSAAIAALSVSFPIQMMLSAVAVGTGVGAGSLISRSLGAEKREDASAAAGQVLFLSLIFGLCVALVGFLYLRPLLVLFGATATILELTVDYMLVITTGAIMLFLISSLNPVIRAEGNAIVPMIAMIASSAVNIILDPIFIFVLGMGVRGAAVATIIAKIVGVGIMLWFYLARRSTLNVRLSSILPNWRIILEIYRVGLPTLLIQISNNMGLIVVNRVLGNYGDVSIAVMGLMSKIKIFAIIPVYGIAQGLLPIIGYNFGASKYLRIREAMLKGSVVGTVFITLAGLALYISPGSFLRVFSSDPELLDIGIFALRIMVLMYPLMFVNIACVTFFQAIGKGTPALWLSLLRQFILYIPFIFIMPRFFGLTGIWMSTPVADLLAFVVTLAVVFREFAHIGIPIFLQGEHVVAAGWNEEV